MIRVKNTLRCLQSTLSQNTVIQKYLPAHLFREICGLLALLIRCLRGCHTRGKGAALIGGSETPRQASARCPRLALEPARWGGCPRKEEKPSAGYQLRLVGFTWFQLISGISVNVISGLQVISRRGFRFRKCLANAKAETGARAGVGESKRAGCFLPAAFACTDRPRQGNMQEAAGPFLLLLAAMCTHRPLEAEGTKENEKERRSNRRRI